jgi:DNA-directed RNA polymerase
MKDITRLSKNIDTKDAIRSAKKALDDFASGKQVNHMVYLDASNQALQLYAILTGDLKTAKTCNIAGEKGMADAYQILADIMNSKLKNNNIDLILTRTNCKKALMTTMYGKSDGSIEIINDLMKGAKNDKEAFEKFA